MNYKKKSEENRRLKELIKLAYPLRGINTKNSEEHEIVKFKIAYRLSKQGFEVFLESPLVTGGRPDIIAIKNQHGYIIEVLCRETEERFLSKQPYYLSDDFTIIKVRVNEFDEDWCL